MQNNRIKLKNVNKFLRNNLDLIQSIGIIMAIITSAVGIFISLNQLKGLNQEISMNSTKYSADIMLYLDNELNSGNNRGIQKAIEHQDPLMQDKGGAYNQDDLERYLDLIETLNDFYYSDLITERMVCVNFSVLVDDAYDNKEVANYIQEIRKTDGDNTIYQGLSDLYSEMSPFRGQQCPD